MLIPVLAAAGGAAWGAEDPMPLSLNVRAFGAVGDGKADDTVALARAFDVACRVETWKRSGRPAPAPRCVVIPPGVYRITKTITLDPRHSNLVINGTGGIARDGNTQLLWDGEAGKPLMQCWSVVGLQMRDLCLHGNDRAGILLRVNSTDKANRDTQWLKRFGQRAASGFFLERMAFVHAETGISLSDDGTINADCSTFLDCRFSHLETGFRTHSWQNLDYLILRPDFGWVGTALHFQGGGFVECSLLNAHHTDVAIRIEGQGINSGVFHF